MSEEEAAERFYVSRATVDLLARGQQAAGILGKYEPSDELMVMKVRWLLMNWKARKDA